MLSRTTNTHGLKVRGLTCYVQVECLYLISHDLEQLSQMGCGMFRDSCCLCRPALPKVVVALYATKAHFIMQLRMAHHATAWQGMNWRPKSGLHT